MLTARQRRYGIDINPGPSGNTNSFSGINIHPGIPTNTSFLRAQYPDTQPLHHQVLHICTTPCTPPHPANHAGCCTTRSSRLPQLYLPQHVHSMHLVPFSCPCIVRQPKPPHIHEKQLFRIYILTQLIQRPREQPLHNRHQRFRHLSRR